MKSPRKRFHIELPDPPYAGIGASAAQLALLVVAVNIVACLIASRAMTNAERDQASRVAGPQAGTERPMIESTYARSASGRLAPLTVLGREPR